MALTTTGSKNKKIKRGASYLMITHRPSEAALDVVSYIAGYNFKSIDDVKIKVGKLDFSLFTQKDTAWTRDTRTDHALTLAIRTNKTLSLTGVPAQKKVGPITDVLDLTGAESAYHAISHACGVEESPLKTSTKITTKTSVKPKKASSSSKF